MILYEMVKTYEGELIQFEIKKTEKLTLPKGNTPYTPQKTEKHT